jgi:hypothetical protein
MTSMEKPFMVDLDRSAAEAVLRGLGTGAFLLRPKDASALVVSCRVAASAGVEHVVVSALALNH